MKWHRLEDKLPGIDVESSDESSEYLYSNRVVVIISGPEIQIDCGFLVFYKGSIPHWCLDVKNNTYLFGVRCWANIPKEKLGHITFKATEWVLDSYIKCSQNKVRKSKGLL